MLEKLRESVLAGATDSSQAAAMWTAFERDTTTSATVELVDEPQVGSATLAGAMDYLESYWQLAR